MMLINHMAAQAFPCLNAVEEEGQHRTPMTSCARMTLLTKRQYLQKLTQ